MNIKGTISLIVILVLVAIIVWGISNQEAYAPATTADGARVMSIEDYVRLNISDISPIKEVLGGKYYVTNIDAGGGKGIVYYEDGHNAHVADFTYKIDERGAITIDSFVVRG